MWKSFKGFIIVGAALIAGIAAFLTDSKDITNFLTDHFGPRKGLQLVRISFKGNDTLDIELRNDGKDAVYVKGILLQIRKRWNINPNESYESLVESSETAALKIPTDKVAPFSAIQNLHLNIEPGRADRFSAFLLPNNNPNGNILFLADVSILYDGGKVTVKQTNILFGFQDINAIYFPKKAFYSADTTTITEEIGMSIANGRKQYEARVSTANTIDSITGLRSPIVDVILNAWRR